MTGKRVDKLQPGDKVNYRQSVWTVTRVRNPGIPGYRSVWLRDDAEPHETDQWMWGVDTIVEVWQ